jgi:hypothetical protein
MLPDAVQRRLDELAASRDPLDQEVGRRLAGRLPQRHIRPASAPAASNRLPSRWAYVDMVDLLGHFGNPVHAAGEQLKSGHEPLHGSRSGTCLVVWRAEGRWWCSSCGRSGDAAAHVAMALGVPFSAAADWLAERYGPPARSKATRWTLRRRVFEAGIR